MGRFTQADTIVPRPADPQSFNRYSYTDNNPINYTDPTGHWSWKKFFHSVVAGVVGGVVTALTGGLAAPLALMWGGMAAGATMGAFEGGVKGALIGAGIGAFMGANIGAGIAMFGSGFGYAALGAAAIYTGATQGWEGLGYMMGGMVGGTLGYQATIGLSPGIVAKAGPYTEEERREYWEKRDKVYEEFSKLTPEQKIRRMEKFLVDYGPDKVQRGLGMSKVYYNPNLERMGTSRVFPKPFYSPIDIGPVALRNIHMLGETMVHEALHVNQGYLRTKLLTERAHKALETEAQKIWWKKMFPQLDKF